MSHRIRIHAVAVAVAFVFSLVASACSPEVGSKAWCEMMKKKPRADWSANEAADYAKHCVFD